MSTSGIMIMIVLLLSLELIQRHGQAGHAAVTFDLPTLQDGIAAASRDLEIIEAELKNGDELVQAASSISVVALKDRLQTLLTANAAFTEERDELMSEVQVQSQATPETMAQEQQKATLNSQIHELAQTRDSLQQQLQQTQQDDRPIFSFPRGTETSGWLVEISAKRIQAAPFGRAERPMVFSGKPGTLIDITPQQEFLDWSAKQSGQHAYFFLLVRPSGAAAFDEICGRFDQLRTRYGFDVMGTDQILLHPERGAVE
ncbi:hypothetical protein [Planctomicrobium piriforme]|uniref:Uncharacterized protein n=1 Tax=Planctomicrobium piriforme TaxID=1576369 RepID=A0A1I3MYB7_9PLAN|nr:hypothetical protein [Planctomicrobium piriforme]SFJ01959.1 hypothetical protein SAMN05421753_114146 [Planctomicrobium piriforme]